MAWLQSSFTSHQLLVENSGSQKRGSKSCTHVKNSDPDKSDTPLLHENVNSPESENSGWLKTSSHSAETQKKPTLLCNTSKSSFLPHCFFDKSLGSTKGKMQVSPNASNNGKKPVENMSLLADEDKKKNPLFNDYDEENDEDSDDEWFVPRGYHRVKPCSD